MATNEDIDYGQITEALNDKADRDFLNLSNSASVPYHIAVENNLQSQIDAITAGADVKAVVGTYADLQLYDKAKLSNDDIVEVLIDEEHSNAKTYYKYVSASNDFTYVGSIGATYTKAESDSRYVHLTDDEDISGKKTFLDNVYINNNESDKMISQKDTGLATNNTTPETNRLRSFRIHANDGSIIGDFRSTVYTTGETWTSMVARRTINGTKINSEIRCIVDNTGSVSTYAPTPSSATDNTDNIATTKHIINVLKAIYPVGSLYIGTQSTCPMSSFFGTWTLVSSGKALWTGNGSNGNTTIAAGLPNITGGFSVPKQVAANYNLAWRNGAFTNGGQGGNSDSIFTNAATIGYYSKVSFKASDSNSIYGASSTVQPPAYVVNVWRRTA